MKIIIYVKPLTLIQKDYNMFDNSGRYKAYKFHLILEDALTPYWCLYNKIKGIRNLVKEITVPKIYKDSYDEIKKLVENQFNQNKGDGTEDEKIELDEIIESISQKVFEFLNSCITRQIYTSEYFKNIITRKKFKDHILAIFFDKEFLIITENCDIELLNEFLYKFFQEYNPISLFIKFLDSKIRDDELNKLVNISLYQNIISNSLSHINIIDLFSPIYPLKTLNFNIDVFKRKEIPTEIYYINEILFQKIYPLIESGDKNKVYCLSKNETDSILNNNEAFLINEKFILPIKANLMNSLSPNINARWIEFRSNVYNFIERENKESRYKRNERYKKGNSDFLKKMKSENFTNIFSFLENNIFLDYESFKNSDKEFLELFEEVTLVSGLEELYNYEIFSSHVPENKIFMGIHKKDKAGSSSYKLLHYMTHEGGKVKNTRNLEPPTTPTCCKVFVLKNRYAFYYLERFYEDYFIEALNEINIKNNIDYIFNQKIKLNNCENEIDIITFNGDKLYFIELKTTLSLESIMQYKKKCVNWMNENPELKDKAEFLIFGAYGKDSLGVCNLKDDNKQWYNVPLENFNGMAYDFDIPLPFEKHLRCITQSSFERLKEKLIEVFNIPQ